MCTGTVHWGLDPSCVCLAAGRKRVAALQAHRGQGTILRLPEVRGADIREAPPAETQQRPGLDHAKRGSVQVLAVPQRALLVLALIDARCEPGHKRDQEHHHQRPIRSAPERADHEPDERREGSGQDRDRSPQPNPAREAEQTAGKQRPTTSQQRPLTRALLLQVDRRNSRSGSAEEEGDAVRLRFEERPTGPPDVEAEIGIGDVAREHQAVRPDGLEQRRQVPGSRRARPGRRGRSAGALSVGKASGAIVNIRNGAMPKRSKSRKNPEFEKSVPDASAGDDREGERRHQQPVNRLEP